MQPGKRFSPSIFKVAGWRTRGALVLEDRVASMLFLVCSTVIAAIGYWYPWYLSTYHASPDDRYGFVIMNALPFYFIGAGIAVVALFRLMRVVAQAQRSAANGVLPLCAVLLALIGFSPLLMVGWRLLSL